MLKMMRGIWRPFTAHGIKRSFKKKNFFYPCHSITELEANSLIYRANYPPPFFDSPIWYTSIESFFQTPSIVYGFFLPPLSSKRNKKEVWAASSLKAFIDIDAGGILPIFSVGSISLSCCVLRATSPYWGVALHFMCTGLFVCMCAMCLCSRCVSISCKQGSVKFSSLTKILGRKKWFLFLKVVNFASWWNLCCQVEPIEKQEGRDVAVVPFFWRIKMDETSTYTTVLHWYLLNAACQALLQENKLVSLQKSRNPFIFAPPFFLKASSLALTLCLNFTLISVLAIWISAHQQVSLSFWGTNAMSSHSL